MANERETSGRISDDRRPRSIDDDSTKDVYPAPSARSTSRIEPASVAYPAVSTSALSDIGLRRTENQDRALRLPFAVVVADGVGGSQGGGAAAQHAVDAFERHLVAPADEASTSAAILAAADQAHTAIRDTARANGWASSATTMVAAVRVADADDGFSHVVVGHVGDSVAMLWRDHQLVRITDDHAIDVDDEFRGTRSVLTRCLGGGVNDHRPDLVTLRSRPGDVFLLCTDGLTKELDDHHIASVLAGSTDAPAICSSLVEITLAKGARDNVTVAVLVEGSFAGQRTESPDA